MGLNCLGRQRSEATLQELFGVPVNDNDSDFGVHVELSRIVCPTLSCDAKLSSSQSHNRSHNQLLVRLKNPEARELLDLLKYGQNYY